MSSIVKYKDPKMGITVVYESTSHYDPVTKKSRPTKKYIGTYNEETGEIIPSSGKRGRVKGSKNKKKEVETESTELNYQTMYEEAMKTVSSQKETIERLQHQLEKYEAVTHQLAQVLKELDAPQDQDH